MRCKKHNTDLSSISGVCASCLRERLLKVILAQEQAQAQSQAHEQCNSSTNSPLPSSVSPYIRNRKSDKPVNIPVAVGKRTSDKPRLNHSLSDQRFYNSPQIAVNTGGCIGATSSNKKKQSLIRFSSFSNLFRSNGRDGDADSNHRVSVSTSGETSGAGGKPTSVTSSPLWFSNVRPGAGGRQKNKSVNVNESSTTAVAGVVRKQICVRNRGMSPVRSSDGDEFSDGSSGYESAESFKQTPKKTPSHQTIRRSGGGQSSSVSELVFCLSPLVRASPHRLWSMKGKPPLDGGDIRSSTVPHLSNVKSFCANRSRKLADFGRSRPNR